MKGGFKPPLLVYQRSEHKHEREAELPRLGRFNARHRRSLSESELEGGNEDGKNK
jgi:hypothetical protein